MSNDEVRTTRRAHSSFEFRHSFVIWLSSFVISSSAPLRKAFESRLNSEFHCRSLISMRLFEGTPFDRPPRCERCGELEAACVCPPATPPRTPPGKQTARLTVEKRKRGKIVTVIRGLAAAENDLPGLLTQLKSTCGAGGTLKDGVLELQGSQLDRVRDAMQTIGYRVKVSGG
jgi:translation initiation factor 1